MGIRIPVVIDTDNSFGISGAEVDDAFALAAALALPALDVLAVTTVHGNAGIGDVTTATRMLMRDLGRPELRVERGAGRPLRRPLRVRIPDGADDGADDDGGAALDALASAVRSRPGEVVIIALGPLTNIARLLTREPDIAGMVKEIVAMGGVFSGTTGRLDLPGEFNIWVDPDAAAVVLGSGAPLRMVGLDVTERVRLTSDMARALAAEDGVIGRLGRHALEWISVVGHRRPHDPRAQGSCAMHDAMAVAAVVRPDLMDWHDARLEVETQSDLTRGVIVADLGLTARPPAPNARIALDIRAGEGIRWLSDLLVMPPTRG
ncbi:nucleoside hydrolase [uncultured Microbacterium sp.]|uniref:nucleoside hydrolase n=1 Tax=uncultured Microbacterium sp. TaxID=191216 RepID=UPI002635F57F|nr:nucleoside hydrolase [uncultured Microbacterium sp.]